LIDASQSKNGPLRRAIFFARSPTCPHNAGNCITGESFAMETQIVLYLLGGVLILVGLVGVVIPVLPGLPLMFVGMLLAAWADHFQRVPIWVIVILGLMSLAALLVDFLAAAFGAKRYGAGKLAVLGAAVGTLVGLLFSILSFGSGIAGLIIGPFLGAVIGELMHGKQLLQASKVGVATWAGLIFGTALKVATAFAMLAIFALALLV
jgi:uncharacterized protein YqgC (DUF456 family)